MLGMPTTSPRDLRALPKAHLHLHFTGAMRHATMLDLAQRHQLVLPDALRDPEPRRLAAADESVSAIDRQFQRGLITEDERYEQVVGIWQDTTGKMSDEMMKSLDPTGPVTMMTASGARGNKGNIGQLGAMRGLMADPSGRIIDVPVRSNFREGMTVLEYFISTHGARKGLADTALRTADSGYLTRRLVDVAQDVITREDDCGTEEGSWIIRTESSDEKGAFQKRLVGRLAAAPLPDPRVGTKKGEEPTLLVDRNELIMEEAAARIDAAGIDEVLVRSPLTCESPRGVCARCYGVDMSTNRVVATFRTSLVRVVVRRIVGNALNSCGARIARVVSRSARWMESVL